jgi:hypothetical protein
VNKPSIIRKTAAPEGLFILFFIFLYFLSITFDFIYTYRQFNDPIDTDLVSTRRAPRATFGNTLRITQRVFFMKHSHIIIWLFNISLNQHHQYLITTMYILQGSLRR